MVEQRPKIETDLARAGAGSRPEPFTASMDRRIEVNRSRVRLLQDMWMKRWGRLPNDEEMKDLLDMDP